MGDNTNTGLMKFDASLYPVLDPAEQEMAELARQQNLGEGDDLRLSDLQTIKVPASGSLFWTIETMANPQGEPHKTFSGVILHARTRRGYWSTEMGDGTAPPDCSSSDGVYGEGTPGGACKTCPLSQWTKSHPSVERPDVKPKCKETRLLFVIRRGMGLPDKVQVPPTSIKPLRAYATTMMRERRPFVSVETEFGLEKDVSEKGKEYARMTFRAVAPTTIEDMRTFQRMAEEMKPMFERVARETTADDIAAAAHDVDI